MPKDATYCEDLAYTNQFFTITRKGHTRPTAEFGAPTLVWHVSFWPRRKVDPHDIDMAELKCFKAQPDAAESGPKFNDGQAGANNAESNDTAEAGAEFEAQVVESFNKRCKHVTEDFNALLLKLQQRGRHPKAAKYESSFQTDKPLDWDPNGAPFDPFNIFNSEATGFTLWWPDKGVLNKIGADSGSVDGLKSSPDNSYLRVRVQVEAHTDFSSITFFIDASKPWDNEPIRNSIPSDIRGDVPGERRRTIYKHVSNISAVTQTRLNANDTTGKPLIDRDLLPEPNPIHGDIRQGLELGYTDSAEALKAAADYLYKDLWLEFCEHFGFDLCDIAGKTDEVFANFRGLVMSTPVTNKEGEEIETPSGVSTPFARFDGGGAGFGQDVTEPNKIVRAFMPFMRRFRPEADWRDWIACGIFDWRAIYITAIGAQSEFDAFDECNYDVATKTPNDIPANHLPERLKQTSDPATFEDTCKEVHAEKHPALGLGDIPARTLPSSLQGDRPAPFRYLLLTKGEPNRKQVGRMIERINTTGSRRLYALKNWTIIQQAGTWTALYGRRLDYAYQRWIGRGTEIKSAYDAKVEELSKNLWAEVHSFSSELCEDTRKKFQISCRRNVGNPNRVCEEMEALEPKDDPDHAEFLKKVSVIKAMDHKLFREAKGNYDVDVAEANRNVERELILITQGLDLIGRAAIGGLPYRISRSRYYAEMFRDAVETLRVGNIETWWSYRQFADRGMEPALSYIANVGERIEKLRSRLQSVKQDVLQSSIASQTEATRDNTHKLERIQAAMESMAESTKELHHAFLETGIKRNYWDTILLRVKTIHVISLILAGGLLYWFVRPFLIGYFMN